MEIHTFVPPRTRLPRQPLLRGLGEGRLTPRLFIFFFKRVEPVVRFCGRGSVTERIVTHSEEGSVGTTGKSGVGFCMCIPLQAERLADGGSQLRQFVSPLLLGERRRDVPCGRNIGISGFRFLFFA